MVLYAMLEKQGNPSGATVSTTIVGTLLWFLVCASLRNSDAIIILRD